jgi:hypothetical protein
MFTLLCSVLLRSVKATSEDLGVSPFGKVGSGSISLNYRAHIAVCCLLLNEEPINEDHCHTLNDINTYKQFKQKTPSTEHPSQHPHLAK